jgi:ribosomal protein S8
MVELLLEMLRNLSKKVVLKLKQMSKKPKMHKYHLRKELEKREKPQHVLVVMTNNKYHN